MLHESRGVDVGTAVDSNSSVFEMALYQYFALGSVLTRVSTLSEKELDKANMAVMHGGCGLVTLVRLTAVPVLRNPLPEHNPPNLMFLQLKPIHQI